MEKEDSTRNFEKAVDQTIDLDRTAARFVEDVENIEDDVTPQTENVLHPQNSDHDTYESEDDDKPLPPMEEEKVKIGEKPAPKKNTMFVEIPDYVPSYVPEGPAKRRLVQLMIKHKLFNPYKLYRGNKQNKTYSIIKKLIAKDLGVQARTASFRLPDYKFLAEKQIEKKLDEGISLGEFHDLKVKKNRRYKSMLTHTKDSKRKVDNQEEEAKNAK